ncbi:hypothetical protein MKW94_023368 [Papaver nudicaule]|uniref:FAS1 domain-containing protein n=1 Tax=Papaver nudicaule TaxID=74823 RepID=A0AA41VGE4_PAPNU|nr:hypothetical protein [Papaver nudicaule]
MSLTLSLAAQTLIFPSPTETILAPSDIAFEDSGQPNLNLLQYHFSPHKFTIKSLKSLPYGTKIPTLVPNKSLIVTTPPGDTDQVSINNVRINDSALLDIGSLTIFSIDQFFDPSFEDFFTLQLSPVPSPKFNLGCKNPFPDDDSSNSSTAKANTTSGVMRSLGYSVMASFLDLQLPDPTRKLTVFAPTDAVLDPYSMNFSSSSVFHRHLLPGKLTASDMLNLVLYGENTVQTIYEGFTVTFTVVGDVLLVNDVPLLYPDIYVSDSIAVHGIQQILSLPIDSLFDEFHGKEDTPSSLITQQPIIAVFPAGRSVNIDSESSTDSNSLFNEFHGKEDTSPSPSSLITQHSIVVAFPAGQTVNINSESSTDSNSISGDFHGKDTSPSPSSSITKQPMVSFFFFMKAYMDQFKYKAPYIEECEEQMQKLQEQRAVAVIQRRTADNASEMMEIEAPLSAAMLVFSKGDYRAEARKRRKALSEAKRMSAVGDDFAHHHIEGESSTDESDSERTSYKSNREMLLQTSEQSEKFQTWKKRFFSSYRDAYMSLSVPAIFSPYVRLELLKRDPLHEESEFDDMHWHSLLFDYGLPEHGGHFNSDDADANLVPGLVEKVALPILHHDIVHCWDMLSTRETRNAISAINMVLNFIPATSEAFLDLLSAIHSPYRFGMSVRLLKIICLWKDILAFPILEQLALDELLSGKVLLPHLQPLVDHVLTLGKTLEKKHISGVSENETNGLARRLKKDACSS